MREGKDQIDLERIICNSADDFEHALEIFDFLLVSTIFCANDGSDLKMFTAIKNRRDKANNWSVDKKVKKQQEIYIKDTCCNVNNFARKIIEDRFFSISRFALLTLNAAFEKRIKDMLFVNYALKNNNLEIKSFFPTSGQLISINKNIQNDWDSMMQSNELPKYKKMLTDLALNLYKLLSISKNSYYSPLSLYEPAELVKDIPNDCWIELQDAYLLRNAITHNRNKSKEQIKIGKQIFLASQDIDPQQSVINQVIKSFRVVNGLFPQNSAQFLF